MARLHHDVIGKGNGQTTLGTIVIAQLLLDLNQLLFTAVLEVGVILGRLGCVWLAKLHVDVCRCLLGQLFILTIGPSLRWENPNGELAFPGIDVLRSLEQKHGRTVRLGFDDHLAKDWGLWFNLGSNLRPIVLAGETNMRTNYKRRIHISPIDYTYDTYSAYSTAGLYIVCDIFVDADLQHRTRRRDHNTVVVLCQKVQAGAKAPLQSESDTRFRHTKKI